MYVCMYMYTYTHFSSYQRKIWGIYMYLLSSIGILAGIWPCGVICVLSELYQSESLAHIYGILHEFVHENSTKLDNLGK